MNRDNTDKGDSDENADVKLKKVLSILRKHLEMKVAFISEFIDRERVYRFVDTEDVKSPIHAGDSDPLEETYCKKIVDNVLTNIIPDAKKNDLTNNLAITDKLSIGSYMGVPITLSNGEVYGTFCCYKDTSDESLNPRDLSYLSAISEIASDLIEKKIEALKTHRKITDRIQSVVDENKIDIHFQPIYCFQTNQIKGFESLSRFTTDPYRSPDIWFAEASQVGLGESLEMMAIEAAVKKMADFSSDIFISINVSPEFVLNGAVSRVMKGVDANRIVIEITEHYPIRDYSAFRLAFEPLRKQGIRLAIDDAGAGYSSFQHILELKPDIVKLDISLTQNIHYEPRKLLLAKALCAFTTTINCTIISEGVETTEELNILKKLGIDKVQGYLIGRPMPVNKAASFVQNII